MQSTCVRRSAAVSPRNSTALLWNENRPRGQSAAPRRLRTAARSAVPFTVLFRAACGVPPHCVGEHLAALHFARADAHSAALQRRNEAQWEKTNAKKAQGDVKLGLKQRCMSHPPWVSHSHAAAADSGFGRFPAAHARQEVFPAAGCTRPAAHATQPSSPGSTVRMGVGGEGRDRPGAHSRHCVAEPGTASWPPGHAITQCRRAPAPTATANSSGGLPHPNGHALHAERAPAASSKRPSGQSKHACRRKPPMWTSCAN